MKTYQESIEIDAPIEKVWKVLTDFKTYKEWNPLNFDVITDGVVGNKITLKYRWGMDAKINTQVENLFAFGPFKMSWGIKNLFLKTRRDIYLEELGPNKTRFTTYEFFSGAVVPLILLLYGRKLKRAHIDTTFALKMRLNEKTKLKRIP